MLKRLKSFQFKQGVTLQVPVGSCGTNIDEKKEEYPRYFCNNNSQMPVDKLPWIAYTDTILNIYEIVQIKRGTVMEGTIPYIQTFCGRCCTRATEAGPLAFIRTRKA